MHLFHVPDLRIDTAELPPDEAHHAIHVLRLGAGVRVRLVDGQGATAEAELLEPGKRVCAVKIVSIERQPSERVHGIHLAVAPTKQMERFEWFLEKAVELGVDRITPLVTQRSERTRMRHDRAMKVMVAAMKQSQRCWLPQLDPLTPLDEMIAWAGSAQRYFGWCNGEHSSLMKRYETGGDALLVIGPEGDLTEDEVALLSDKGFTAVSIGNARLRTETAAIAACSWMSLSQQR